jgi:hypothetical protein
MRKLIIPSILCAAMAARAGVPSGFSVEGVLRSNTGQLQSMMVNVSVSLYDAQTGGNKLAGPFGPTMVLAQNGLFALPIQDAMLQTELAGASDLWLEATVGSDVFPRQQVTPQIWALQCGTADVAMSMPNVTVANGNLGIGAPNPHGTLEVGSAVVVAKADGVSTITSEFYAQDLRLKARGGNMPDLVVSQSGNVGIGTASPGYTLDVNGSVRLAGIQLFQKPGNNGSAPCNVFCQGSQWGQVGSCVGGRTDNGGYVDCASVPGIYTICICAAIP